MKHGFKRITKTTIALVLALCVLISVAVPVMAAGIQTLIGRVTELSQTGGEEYKGEKVTGEDGKPFYRMDSMTEAQYASFGLNTKATPKTFSSSPESEVDSYTELDGLMSLGMYYNGTDIGSAKFNVYTSSSISDNTDKGFDLVNGDHQVYSTFEFDKDLEYAQEQNMEGIDIDNDGFDEVATVRLSRPLYVELYDPPVNNQDEPYKRLAGWSAEVERGAGVSDMQPFETMGYMALTAGDFDGDGGEELVVYVPTDHPVFYLLKYVEGKDTLQELAHFRLEDVSGGKGKRLVYNTDGNLLPNNGWPAVSLSTTSISGKDHIVFNASLPLRYDGYDNRSCMAILDYDGSDTLRELYSDDLTYGNGSYRMRFASATDGDVYGNGEQVLIVGGYKNSDLGNDPSRYNTKQGGLSDILVQTFKYDIETNEYKRADTKTASRHSEGMCHMEGNNVPNPLAVAAVNFINSANAPEFLFLGGKIFKWSDSDALIEKYEMRLGDHNNDDPFIVKAFAIQGINGNYAQEQLFVIAGDTDAGRKDHDYMHTHTIINTNNAGKVDESEATTDDVVFADNFHDSWARVDEDDDGDFCTAAPLQWNGHGASIRCTEKSVGWSDITVEAVLQSVPYWEELDYDGDPGSSSFVISSGKSTGQEHEVVHSNGGFLEVSLVFGFELFNIGGNVGMAGSIEGHHNHGNQDGREYAISDSLTISSSAGNDTVALSATAFGHYTYQVKFPKHIVTANEHQYMVENYSAYGYQNANDVPAVGELSDEYTTYCINHVNYGQTYSQIEVNKFNEKVQAYYDAGGSEEKLGKVDMSKYNSAVIGDAYSYPADKSHIHYWGTQDINGTETDMIFEAKNTASISSAAEGSVGIDVEFEQTISSGTSTGYDIGGTIGATGEIDFLIGQADASAGYGGEREENTSYSNSTIAGKAFGVELSFWKDYTEDSDNSGVDATKYNFSFTPVVLQSLPLSNGNTPFMLTCIVTPMNEGHVAPPIPDDIHVDTVSASALNVTWKNVSTPARPVSQYGRYGRRDGDLLPRD